MLNRAVLLVLLLILVPLVAHTEEPLSLRFALAVTQLRAGNEVEASENFRVLREEIYSRGYDSSSYYAEELLRQVETTNNSNQALLMLRQALALSPNDPVVLLSAAKFVSLLGLGEACSLAVKGVRLLSAAPFSRSALLVNLFLVVALSGTLAMFFATVVLLASSREIILAECSAYLPRTVRGMLAPLVVLGALTLPLVGGLIMALGVWCLLLTFFVERCRWFGMLAGALTLFWGLGLSPIGQALSGLSSMAVRQMEWVSQGSFAPVVGGDRSLRSLVIQPSEQLLPAEQFAVGLMLVRDGAPDKGANYFSALANVYPHERGVIQNLVIAQLRAGKLTEAQETLKKLEALGELDFEGAYTKAQLALKQIDTAAYRDAYVLAQSLDAARTREYDNLKGRNVGILAPLPASFVTKELYSNRAATVRSGVEARRRDLLRALSPLGGLSGLTLWGVGVLGVGMLLAGRKFQERMSRQHQAIVQWRPLSQLWSLVPGGIWLAGAHPNLGLGVIFLAFCLTIFAVEAPFHLVAVFPVTPIDSWKLFAIAALVLFAVAIVSVRNVGRGGQVK